MADNITKPTDVSVETYLQSVSEKRQLESRSLMAMMRQISGEKAVMWGPSIIGFGTYRYKYETGREGDIPLVGFSPRKQAITIYIADGFDKYGPLLDKLGKHTTSVSCLYIPALDNVDIDVLRQIVQGTYDHHVKVAPSQSIGWESVDQYISSLRGEQKRRIEQLHALALEIIPDGEDAISYQLPTRKYDGKSIVHYAAFSDHIGVYPVPKGMDDQVSVYQRGKGTLWFGHDKPLPMGLIKRIMVALLHQHTSIK